MRRSIVAVAAVIAVTFSDGAMPIGVSSDAARGLDIGGQTSGGRDQHRKFVDRHGLVLSRELLYLIYWGSAWTYLSTTPTADQVTSAVRTMFASSYLTGLAQYRGVVGGEVRESTVLASSEPPSKFTDKEVGRFVRNQIAAGTIAGPDAGNQTVYGVVMPPGVRPITPAFGEGEHNYSRGHGQTIHYAWFANAGSLHALTGIMSHEIVEAATDPEGKGFIGVDGTCSQDGWCEIADVCRSAGVVDGVAVRSYWSNEAGKCIIPTASVHPKSARAAPDGQVRLVDNAPGRHTTPSLDRQPDALRAERPPSTGPGRTRTARRRRVLHCPR